MKPYSPTEPDYFCLKLVSLLLITLLTSCGGDEETLVDTLTVSAIADSHGSISPSNATVILENSVRFTVTPDRGYRIKNVSGCNGALSDNIYITGGIYLDCVVEATFIAVETVDVVAPM